ncbi:hypothetical protein [Pedobacter xixiisoli]|uniref:Uncharacterized protein n=1 Tax=Pedobacter xixiisoli TaxID=1476464 RepID=A0A285ZSX7_9SPHI|nr:hypothetical protein [Pedobacter xixiisoli]SOD12764.1 hypothetical protein SAMN06297358_0836 [Pedobacter xixiisoli]
MADKYVPSGIASPSGVLKTILFGILASFILPIIYIILVRLIPNIWFNGICALLLGMGLGFFIDLGIKIGKIRNFKVAIAIAVFCGLLAFYFQWIVFDALMYSANGFTFKLSGTDIGNLFKDAFYLFTHPIVLFDEIKYLNEIGTFRIKGSSTVSGGMLWFIWFGEFLVIMGGIIFAVGNGQVTQPFSETYDKWMERRKLINRINYIHSKDDFLIALSNKNTDLLKHNPELVDQQNFAEVVVFELPGEQAKYINVINVDNAVDKKGRVTAKKKNLFTNLRITNLEV